MLPTIVLTVIIFGLAAAAMAVGVMVAGKRLSGSCGGLGGGSCECTPEKQAQCKKRGDEHHAHAHAASGDDEEDDHFTVDPYQRPGEERLIQLRSGR